MLTDDSVHHQYHQFRRLATRDRPAPSYGAVPKPSSLNSVLRCVRISKNEGLAAAPGQGHDWDASKCTFSLKCTSSLFEVGKGYRPSPIETADLPRLWPSASALLVHLGLLPSTRDVLGARSTPVLSFVSASSFFRTFALYLCVCQASLQPCFSYAFFSSFEWHMPLTSWVIGTFPCLRAFFVISSV